MITLFLGAFVIVAMLVFGASKWLIALACIITAVIALSPLEGYNETKCIAQIPLLRLNSRYFLKCEDVGMFNLMSVIFAYDNKDMYDLSGVSYEEAKIVGKVKIYEDSECTEPILKVFTTTPRREGFCLAPFSNKVEYVFVIPEEEYNIRRTFFKDDEEKSYTKLSQIKKISEAMQKNMEDKEVIGNDEQSGDNSDSRLV